MVHLYNDMQSRYTILVLNPRIMCPVPGFIALVFNHSFDTRTQKSVSFWFVISMRCCLVRPTDQHYGCPSSQPYIVIRSQYEQAVQESVCIHHKTYLRRSLLIFLLHPQLYLWGFLRVLRFPPLLHQLMVQPIKYSSNKSDCNSVKLTS